MPDRAREIAELGIRITNAANAQYRFEHPGKPDWAHHSFCLFAGKVRREGRALRAQSVVAIQPGKLDRSPTGTAVSARMALLQARGEMGMEDQLTGESIIGSEFTGRILGNTKVGALDAIRPRSAAALGSPAPISTCWIRVIPGRVATASRTLGLGSSEETPRRGGGA